MQDGEAVFPRLHDTHRQRDRVVPLRVRDNYPTEVQHLLFAANRWERSRQINGP